MRLVVCELKVDIADILASLGPCQSGTHCHTTVDPLNFSVFSSDFKDRTV